MTLPAQPVDQCALHCPLGNGGELPTSGNYGSGSSDQAQPPREPNKASAYALRNASHLLPSFSRFLRAHGGLQSACGERRHAQVDFDRCRGADPRNVEGVHSGFLVYRVTPTRDQPPLTRCLGRLPTPYSSTPTRKSLSTV